VPLIKIIEKGGTGHSDPCKQGAFTVLLRSVTP